MTVQLARREAALALLALLAGVAALIVTLSTRPSTRKLPAPVGSYEALAGSRPASTFAQRTVCGTPVDAATQGVSHPVLPCGMRVYITYRDRTALTQVISHAPTSPDAQFILTQRLAQRLGLAGVQTIRWSYAAAG